MSAPRLSEPAETRMAELQAAINRNDSEAAVAVVDAVAADGLPDLAESMRRYLIAQMPDLASAR